MKINCLSCGFKVDLDDTYDDFEGPIKCLCGALLEIRTEEGMLKGIKLVEPPSRTAPSPSGWKARPPPEGAFRPGQATEVVTNAGLSGSRRGYLPVSR